VQAAGDTPSSASRRIQRTQQLRAQFNTRGQIDVQAGLRVRKASKNGRGTTSRSAENNAGYKNLIQPQSRAFLEGYYRSEVEGDAR